jgi:hypothetical protein
VNYFVLPILGTPYNRYHHLENNIVVAIDISRPEGVEVPIPDGVTYKVRLVEYPRKRVKVRKH